MIGIIQGISGKYFSTAIPDITITSPQESVRVVLEIDGEEVFNEKLFTDEHHSVTMVDLSDLVEPYAKRRLIVTLGVKIGEGDAQPSAQMSAEVLYSKADLSTTCADFCDKHFLTTLLGTKTTAVGRLEYLHYVGTDAATVTAHYTNGSTEQFTPRAVGGNGKYITIDVSPSGFISEGKTLISYVVTAGKRSQTFSIDLSTPDCAPTVIFVNSFGVDELLYCTGTHKIAPSYKRETMFIRSTQRNYLIEETRSMTANTGVMSFAEAQWAEDLFRSEYVRVVNFYNGHATPGKEILITDAKAERTNDDDELPRFTFTYQYAQRNQNVMDLNREGRIFDNTFDNTFE